jgi:S-adenosylmethionine:tRNA ribosyltransferase-isomerase
MTRRSGGRVIAVGTTVVRALESAALTSPCQSEPCTSDGPVAASAGWTSHVVTRHTGVAVVDGLLTGLHEPRSTHLWMLAAFAGDALLRRCYDTAAARGYRWHEFGDVHLLVP